MSIEVASMPFLVAHHCAKHWGRLSQFWNCQQLKRSCFRNPSLSRIFCWHHKTQKKTCKGLDWRSTVDYPLAPQEGTDCHQCPSRCCTCCCLVCSRQRPPGLPRIGRHFCHHPIAMILGGSRNFTSLRSALIILRHTKSNPAFSYIICETILSSTSLSANVQLIDSSEK